MLVHDSNVDRQYNVEGLKSDYYALKQSLYRTRDKKERKEIAGWLISIREILEELGEEVPQ